MAKKTILLNIIFVLAIVFSTWLMLHNNPHLSNASSKDNQINAFMHNVIYEQYNKAGQLHQQLTAKRMTYYAKNNIAYFVDPAMQIYSDQGTPWSIHANFGKSEHGTQKVKLWQQVVINSTDKQANGTVTTIKTNKMTILPKKSLAQTKSFVTITRPGVIIQGKGLQTNFKTEISKILTQVSSSYDPKAIH